MRDTPDKMKRPLMMTNVAYRRSRIRWMQWLRDEHGDYADPKFDDIREAEHDPHMKDEGVGKGSWWENQVFQYVGRADTLGLDNPLGRQALMKGLACYTGMIESMIRVYGDPPLPGVPSGEIRERYPEAVED